MITVCNIITDVKKACSNMTWPPIDCQTFPDSNDPYICRQNPYTRMYYCYNYQSKVLSDGRAFINTDGFK